MPTALALLFGYDYDRDPQNRLRGCHNDVDNMHRYLIEKRGYSPEQIETYKDSHPESTCLHALISTLERAMQKTHDQDLDEVFIHYSGHGTQIRTRREIQAGAGDDPHTAEVIMPWDFRENGCLADFQLHGILSQANPKTKILCVFDCCHSATLANLSHKYTWNPTRQTFDPIQKKDNAPQLAPLVVTLSGCRDDQTSADAYNVQGHHQYAGALSACFVSEVSEKSTPVFDFMRDLYAMLQRKNFRQIPVLCASRELEPETCVF